MTNVTQSGQETVRNAALRRSIRSASFSCPAHCTRPSSLIISASFWRGGLAVSSSFSSCNNSWLELVQSSLNMFHAGIENRHYYGAILKRQTMTTGKQRLFYSALCLDEEIKVCLKVRIQWSQFEKVICEVSRVRILLHCCRLTAKPEKTWLRRPSGKISGGRRRGAVRRASDMVQKVEYLSSVLRRAQAQPTRLHHWWLVNRLSFVQTHEAQILTKTSWRAL